MGNTVKKQHYVWRNYLSKWADSDDKYKGKLFVLRKKTKGNQDKIEFRELEKIGFEKYYYDITGFKSKDVQILNKLIAHMQRNELAKFGITEESLKEAYTQRDFIEKKVMCTSENIENKFHFYEKLLEGDLSFYQDSKNQNILDTLMENILTSMFYGEERLSEQQLVNLVKEFSIDQTTDLKYEFNRFFCMQYFRSPRVHMNTKKNIEELKQKYEEISDMDPNFFTNMVMLYFAERMALNITQNFKSRILLYKNNTGIPFVTGDTPIICLTGNKMDGMSVYHYPISPERAVELIVVPKFGNFAVVNNVIMELTQGLAGVVRNCNKKLADNCVNEVY